MNNDEIVYIEGGGAFSMETALKWIGVTVLGAIAWDVLKWACIKVGAWAAINTVAICTVVSRVVAIAMFTFIVANYGV